MKISNKSKSRGKCKVKNMHNILNRAEKSKFCSLYLHILYLVQKDRLILVQTVHCISLQIRQIRTDPNQQLGWQGQSIYFATTNKTVRTVLAYCCWISLKLHIGSVKHTVYNFCIFSEVSLTLWSLHATFPLQGCWWGGQ